MTGWAKRRFWTTAEVVERADGFSVALDGRMIKTPARADLTLPTRLLAERVAAEWQAQDKKIDPETMPATRAANAAIDKVRGQFGEVAALITAYGETDLLCYRATGPAALRARQAVAWDPLLEWSVARFCIRWHVVSGVMPQPQPEATLTRLAGHVAGFSPFELTAFHDLVAMSGSLVIGLAAAEQHDAPELLWRASRIDEDWQIEQWGADADAEALAAVRRQSFLDAAAFFLACR
ncbi:MAG: ATP12 family chaperone protein [Pararhodobacter sp.]